ncbi:retrovirus-related pol polyprotein from transposon TNT 1-94 [Tanacetum coccineum]
MNHDRVTCILVDARSSSREKHYLGECGGASIVHLNATVKNIRTDNGTEFVNQTLKSYYEDASLVLWSEAVTTTCYTHNRSLIHSHHNKTPYELLHDRKPDLKYFHVFGALCYLTNDSEDLGKLKPEADIRPELQLITRGTISSGLVQTQSSSKPYVSPIKKEWDILFQPIFDEYYQSSPSVVSCVHPAVAPIPADTTGTPLSTSINQDAPSASTSPTSQETQSPIIHPGVEEQIQGTKTT